MNNYSRLLDLHPDELKNIKIERIQKLCIGSLECQMDEEYNKLVEFIIIRVLEVNNPESLDSYYDNIFPKILDNFKNNIRDTNDKNVNGDLPETIYRIQIAANFLSIITKFLRKIVSVYQYRQNQLTKFFIYLLKIIESSLTYRKHSFSDIQELNSAFGEFFAQRNNILAFIVTATNVLTNPDDSTESLKTCELLTVLCKIAEALLYIDNCVAISLKTWKSILTLSISKSESLKTYKNTHWILVAFKILNHQILNFLIECKQKHFKNEELDQQKLKLNNFYTKIITTLISTFEQEDFITFANIYDIFRALGPVNFPNSIIENFIKPYNAIIVSNCRKPKFIKDLLEVKPCSFMECWAHLYIISKITEDAVDDENSVKLYMQDRNSNLLLSIFNSIQYFNSVFDDNDLIFDLVGILSIFILKSIANCIKDFAYFEKILTESLLTANFWVAYLSEILMCCLIKKISSDDYRLKYFLFLKSLHDTTAIQITSPSIVHVEKLMTYTYANLSNSSKQVIIQNFSPPLNLKLWAFLGLSEIINIQEREQFQTEIIGKTIECIDEFLTSPIKSTENFYEMLKLFRVCATMKSKRQEEFHSRILKLWILFNNVTDFEIWSTLIMLLLDITKHHINSFKSDEFITILQIIDKISGTSRGITKIRILGFLNSISSSYKNVPDELLTSTISNILYSALNGSDVIVKLNCLAVLTKMTMSYQFKDIVRRTLAIDDTLKVEFAIFSENKIYNPDDDVKMINFLNAQNMSPSPEHKCRTRFRSAAQKRRTCSETTDDFNFDSIEFDSVDSFELELSPHNKRLKSNDQEEKQFEILDRIRMHVSDLKEHCTSSKLSVRNFNCVKAIITDLESFD